MNTNNSNSNSNSNSKKKSKQQPWRSSTILLEWNNSTTGTHATSPTTTTTKTSSTSTSTTTTTCVSEFSSASSSLLTIKNNTTCNTNNDNTTTTNTTIVVPYDGWYGFCWQTINEKQQQEQLKNTITTTTTTTTTTEKSSSSLSITNNNRIPIILQLCIMVEEGGESEGGEVKEETITTTCLHWDITTGNLINYSPSTSNGTTNTKLDHATNVQPAITLSAQTIITPTTATITNQDIQQQRKRRLQHQQKQKELNSNNNYCNNINVGTLLHLKALSKVIATVRYYSLSALPTTSIQENDSSFTHIEWCLVYNHHMIPATTTTTTTNATQCTLLPILLPSANVPTTTTITIPATIIMKPYVCALCLRTFVSSRAVHSHIISMHNNNTNNKKDVTTSHTGCATCINTMNNSHNNTTNTNKNNNINNNNTIDNDNTIDDDDDCIWNKPLQIIYQDQYVVVINKPQGMSVMGAKPSLVRSNLLLPLSGLYRPSTIIDTCITSTTITTTCTATSTANANATSSNIHYNGYMTKLNDPTKWRQMSQNNDKPSKQDKKQNNKRTRQDLDNNNNNNYHHQDDDDNNNNNNDSIRVKPRPVHRLDSATGGLLVLAKTKYSESSLRTAFAERRVHKRYRAIVLGKLVPSLTNVNFVVSSSSLPLTTIVPSSVQKSVMNCTTDTPPTTATAISTANDAGVATTIVELSQNITNTTVSIDIVDNRSVIEIPVDGKYSKSYYKIVQYIRSIHTKDTYMTIVDLWPHTGRRHQLRKHLSSIGHPILGDRRYQYYYYNNRMNINSMNTSNNANDSVNCNGIIRGSHTTIRSPEPMNSSTMEISVPDDNTVRTTNSDDKFDTNTAVVRADSDDDDDDENDTQNYKKDSNIDNDDDRSYEHKQVRNVVVVEGESSKEQQHQQLPIPNSGGTTGSIPSVINSDIKTASLSSVSLSFTRLCLFAVEITFPHPTTNIECTCTLTPNNNNDNDNDNDNDSDNPLWITKVIETEEQLWQENGISL